MKVWLVEDPSLGTLSVCASKERAEQAAQEAAEAHAATVPDLVQRVGHDEVVRRTHGWMSVTEKEVLS